MANSAKEMKNQFKKNEVYPYPSRYGSHSSMFVAVCDGDSSKVICKDEKGEYVTDKKILDSGVADANRFERY